MHVSSPLLCMPKLSVIVMMTCLIWVAEVYIGIDTNSFLFRILYNSEKEILYRARRCSFFNLRKSFFYFTEGIGKFFYILMLFAPMFWPIIYNWLWDHLMKNFLNKYGRDKKKKKKSSSFVMKCWLGKSWSTKYSTFLLRILPRKVTVFRCIDKTVCNEKCKQV